VLGRFDYVFFYRGQKSVGEHHGQCLTEDTLTEYLEGSLDLAMKAASEVHLIACDGCRGKLGFYMRMLNEEIDGDEAAAVQSVTDRWNKTKLQLPRRTGTLPSWLFGFVAIAAVLVLGVLSIRALLDRQAQPRSASDIVQLLLAQHRPFEARLANEPHLPIIRTRGLDDPGVAYGLIAGEMTKLSADSHQMGRFYLLQKDFVHAIPYLEIAGREVGAGPEVHNDLGVAYLEGDESRLDRASEEFRRALDLNPKFAPAVFNLALYYERTNSPDQADLQWKHYLELDPNSEWGKEARKRLQGLSR
jgi:tetratricopeptide (TPR) repeat protein